MSQHFISALIVFGSLWYSTLDTRQLFISINLSLQDSWRYATACCPIMCCVIDAPSWKISFCLPRMELSFSGPFTKFFGIIFEFIVLKLNSNIYCDIYNRLGCLMVTALASWLSCLDIKKNVDLLSNLMIQCTCNHCCQFVQIIWNIFILGKD